MNTQKEAETPMPILLAKELALFFTAFKVPPDVMEEKILQSFERIAEEAYDAEDWNDDVGSIPFKTYWKSLTDNK